MKRKTSVRSSLRLERLEDRIVPLHDLPWPVTPSANPLLTTYGQYQEFQSAGIYLHPGIDILVSGTPTASAIQPGVVHGVKNNGAPNPAWNRWVSVRSDENGWNYLHIAPGNNPQGMVWAAGNQVPATDPRQVMGTVQAFPGGLNHLHLEYTATNADGRIPTLLRPLADPLAYLTSLNDQTRPTVSSNIMFRGAFYDGPIQSNLQAIDPINAPGS